MKSLIASILMIALVAVKSFSQDVQTTPTTGGAQISFVTEDIDYGKIDKGADGIRFFEIVNNGDRPLNITSCSGSCGCTVPTCPKEPVLPGQTAKIQVKYDTNRVGPFTKTITIVSNAVNAPSKTVKMHGEILNTDAPVTNPVSPVNTVPNNN